MMEFFTDVVRTAWKPHKCRLCESEIPAKTKYRRQSGKFNDSFFDLCLHIHCNDIISKFCNECSEQEWSPEEVEHWLADEYCCSCEQQDDCEVSVFQCPLITKDFTRDNYKTQGGQHA